MAEDKESGKSFGAPPEPRQDMTSLVAEFEREQVRAALFDSAPKRAAVGNYRVESLLGEGAMGTVFVGVDETLGRRVAIKQIKGTDDEARRARMLREAQALAKLSHPNVVPVYEAGEHDGRLYFAMELVDGVDLGEWVRTEQPGWRDVVAAYLQAADGLAAAHEAGLVHRDFKPSNVVIGSEGRVRVLDFGVAAVGAPDSPDHVAEWIETADKIPGAAIQDAIPLTATGGVVGTPVYMAPEQFAGDTVDGRADQFSFCVSLYEALYGQRPFSDRSILARIDGGVGVPTVPPRRTPVPRYLWSALRQGLSQRPEDRFESMRALRTACDPGRVLRRRVLVSGGVGAMGLVGVAAWFGSAPEPCQIDSEALGDSWTPARRDEILRAFEATGLPYSELSYRIVERGLDDWSVAWLEAKKDACHAARVTGVDSVERMDARMVCLDRLRERLAANTEALRNADRPTVARSAAALVRLPDIGVCSQPELPQDRIPPPSDPLSLRQFNDTRAALDRAEVLKNLGNIDGASQVLLELGESPEELRHPPTRLRKALLKADLELLRGNLNHSIPALLEVAREAESQHCDDLAASARSSAARGAVGMWSKPEQERWLVADARAAVERVGRKNDPRLFDLAVAEARLDVEAGDHDTAIHNLRDALVRAEQRGATHYIVQLRAEIARAALDAGRPAEAQREFADARAVAGELLGAEHPSIADLELDLCLSAMQRGDFPRAREHLSAAKEGYLASLGPNSLPLARAEFVSVKLTLNSGDPASAASSLESVIRIYEEELDPTSTQLAEAYTARGVLSFYAGRYSTSIEDYERALRIRVQAQGSEHLEVGLLQSNIGESQLALGLTKAAAATFDVAIATMKKTHPADHVLFALPFKGRGQALLAEEKYAAAASSLETALRLHEANPGERFELADTLFSLARATFATDPRRARTLANRAIGEFRDLSMMDRVRAVKDWLPDMSTNTNTNEERTRE